MTMTSLLLVTLLGLSMSIVETAVSVVYLFVCKFLVIYLPVHLFICEGNCGLWMSLTDIPCTGRQRQLEHGYSNYTFCGK